MFPLRDNFLSEGKFARFSLNSWHFFRIWFWCGSDVVRTWFGCGSDVVRMWFGRGSDVVRTWFGGGHVFGSGADSQLWGLRDDFLPLKIAFPYPSQWPHFPWKSGFYGLSWEIVGLLQRSKGLSLENLKRGSGTLSARVRKSSKNSRKLQLFCFFFCFFFFFGLACFWFFGSLAAFFLREQNLLPKESPKAKKVVNSLARLLTLGNGNSLARLFSKVCLRTF